MKEKQETRLQPMAREYPLGEEITTHFHILAWKIPWTEEPRGLQSKGLQRVEHDWGTAHTQHIKQIYSGKWISSELWYQEHDKTFITAQILCRKYFFLSVCFLHGYILVREGMMQVCSCRKSLVSQYIKTWEINSQQPHDMKIIFWKWWGHFNHFIFILEEKYGDVKGTNIRPWGDTEKAQTRFCGTWH